MVHKMSINKIVIIISLQVGLQHSQSVQQQVIVEVLINVEQHLHIHEFPIKF